MNEEGKILEKIRGGDKVEFETLFKSSFASLFYYSYGITGRTDVSEELVQELFFRLWLKRESIFILTSLKGYLFRSIRNLSLDYIKRERKFENIDSQISDTGVIYSRNPLDELELKELEESIEKSIKKMTTREREAFVLHRLKGLKYKEIAINMGVSVKQIEKLISKALKKIRL